MPSEITCTIGTASRLVAYPSTSPLPLPGTACDCGYTLLCFGGPGTAPAETATPTAPTARATSTPSARAFLEKRLDSPISGSFLRGRREREARDDGGPRQRLLDPVPVTILDSEG